MKNKLPIEIRNVLPINEEQLIVLMKFGSHLYGTDTPTSDIDYNGIYMPTKEQILLNNIPKSASYHSKKTKEEGVRNLKDDIDIQIFSIHHFIELALKGETVALDMLHAPRDWPDLGSDIWDLLQKQRRFFYTKDLKAFVGYTRKQAAKYGLKGSRLADIKNVIEFLEEKRRTITDKLLCGLEPRLSDVWEDLPTGEHIYKLYEDTPLPMYQVAGYKFNNACKLDYLLPILQKFYDQYGERAKLAEKNEGIDWKAVSHALRAAIQVSQLLSIGTITYPLRQAKLLTKVKLGEYDYITQVSPLLELYMDQCEKFSQLSNFPNQPDRKFWETWLVKLVEQVLI